MKGTNSSLAKMQANPPILTTQKVREVLRTQPTHPPVLQTQDTKF